MNSRPPSDNQPPPPPPSPREELEARLTALALGEAGEFEAETLHARIAADPDLAALYRRIEAAILAYKNTFEDERASAHLPALEPAPKHLSADRAARLAQLFTTDTSATPTPAAQPVAKPRRIPSRKILPFPAWTQALTAVACLLLFAFFAANFITSKLGMSATLSQHGAVHMIASAEVKKQKAIADENDLADKRPVAPQENFAIYGLGNNSNPGASTAPLPQILSAVQLANAVSPDNSANSNGGGNVNNVAAQWASNDPQSAAQWLNETTHTQSSAFGIDSGTAPLGASFTNPTLNNPVAFNDTQVQGGTGLPPVPPPPPPPAPMAADSPPSGSNFQGNNFGTGNGRGRAGGGAPGGRGGQGGRGGRGGAVASAPAGAAGFGAGGSGVGGVPASAPQTDFLITGGNLTLGSAPGSAAPAMAVANGGGSFNAGPSGAAPTLITGLATSKEALEALAQMKGSDPIDPRFLDVAQGPLKSLDSRWNTSKSADTTFTGVISGSGGNVLLDAIGTGNLALAGGALDNTFGGNATLIADNGQVVAGDWVNNVGSNTRTANSFDKSGSGSWTLAGNNNYTGNTTISNGQPTLGGAGDLTFVGSNSINLGSTAVRQSGGVVTLSGNNSFSGATYMSGGTLTLGRSSTLGSVNGNLTNDGGQIDKSGNGTLSFGSLTDVKLGGLSDTSQVDYESQYVFRGEKRTENNNLGAESAPASGLAFNGGALQYNGPTKDADMVFTVGDNNQNTTYSGTFTGTGGLVKVGSGSIVLQGGGLQWDAGTTADVSNEANGRFGGLRDTLNPKTNYFDTNGNNVTFATAITGNGTVAGQQFGDAIVTKSGAGTLTLTGTNTYTGNTVISGGAINFSSNAQFGAAPNISIVPLNDAGVTAKEGGGTLTITIPQTYTGNYSGAGSSNPPDGWEWGFHAIARNENQGANQSGVFIGNLSGTGGLTKAGNGTLSLNNSNSSYGGGTTLNSGTLQLGEMTQGGKSDNSANTPISSFGSGDLNLRAGGLTLNANTLTIGGTVTAGGTLQLGNGTASGTMVNNGPNVLSPITNLDLSGAGVGGGRGNDAQAAPAQQIARATAVKPAAPAAAIALPALQSDQPASRPPSEVKFPAPIDTTDNAFSTFALNVNDASYQLARTALLNHRWPDPATTRTEEFLNAFRYHDPAPATGEACALHYDLGQNPIESGDLLRVSFQTAAGGRDRTTPLRLTILLDDSGSMTRADRAATVQAALRALGQLLRAEDQVSLVTFARTPQVRATALSANHYNEILALAGSIEPEGGTNMEEALRTAYATARLTFDEHAQNRVILLTDGAANLGELDPAALAGIVEENRKAGIALDAYGVGWDGYDDTTLEALTRKSDGRYAFLNTPQDVNTAFAAKLAGALSPAANDVKLQIEFNPQRVTSYRLMGYNNLRLTKEQFRDNTVNAGELAAADQGTALYNLVLNPTGAGPIGTARARYRDPGTTNYHEVSWTIQYNGLPVAFDQAAPALRLAAVAGYFAEYLQQSPYAAGVTPRQLLELLRGVPQAFAPDARPSALVETLTAAASLAGN